MAATRIFFNTEFIESIFLLFLLWTSTHKSSSEKLNIFSSHLVAKPHSMRCIDMDPDFEKTTTCSLKPVNRTLKFINVYVELRKPPVNYARVHFNIQKRANGGYKPFGINVVIDGCQYLAGKKNIIFDWFYSQLVNYSNFNHPCPFENDVYLKDYPFQNIYTPSVFPLGDYRVETMLEANGKPRIKFQLYVTIEEQYS